MSAKKMADLASYPARRSKNGITTEIGWAKDSIARKLLRQNGLEFVNPAPQGRWSQWGPEGECLSNAMIAALEDDSVTYCEGIAISYEGQPLCHAWLINEDLEIIETTFPKLGKKYFGIPITTKFLKCWKPRPVIHKTGREIRVDYQMSILGSFTWTDLAGRWKPKNWIQEIVRKLPHKGSSSKEAFACDLTI